MRLSDSALSMLNSELRDLTLSGLMFSDSSEKKGSLLAAALTENLNLHR